ncbi:MAG TPA: hypothetical protein DCW90_10005 [Lachnospiraceae bacterium]|nr:hypothetical protein [Lachnospiraceae bacterium]
MINAETARNESEKTANEKLSEELKEVEKCIEWAVEKGSYSTYYDGTLNSKTVNTLRKLGYKVEYGSQYNESYYSISW